MKHLIRFFACFSVVFLSGTISHADVLIGTAGDARLVTEPSGARDDNNGGNTISGALIGLNTGGIDNFMVFEFDDLSAVAGQTVTGATVSFEIATTFTNGNHGTTADIINLHEIVLSNLGWESGTGAIGGGDNSADDGSASFLNRAQFNGSGTTEAWQDAAGNDVANLLGALTLLDSQTAWNQGAAPSFLTYAIDAATAQGWVDNGLGGIALSTTDDGDSRSCFNFGQGEDGDFGAANINFITAVPEPGSASVLAICGLAMLVRRKRS